MVVSYTETKLSSLSLGCTMPLSNSEQRLVQTLIENGPTYRADLARILNVSRTTITNLTNSVTRFGFVTEGISPTPNLKKPLTLTPKFGILISVAYHYSEVEITVSTLCGEVLGHGSKSINSTRTPLERLALGAELVETTLLELHHSTSQILGIHLAVDTQINIATGKVHTSSASRKWKDVNPKEFFEAQFNVPVFVENTARLRGLAEATWGAGSGTNNVYYVHLSYGVTGAQIIEGAIQAGAKGGSGELGHTIYSWNGPLCACGNRGCLMQYVSIPALERDAAAAFGSATNFPTFVKYLDQNAAEASTIMKQVSTVLSHTLLNICHLLDPEIIILGGELSQLNYPLTNHITQFLRRHALPLSGTQVEVVTQKLQGEKDYCGIAGINSLRREQAILQLALNR